MRRLLTSLAAVIALGAAIAHADMADGPPGSSNFNSNLNTKRASVQANPSNPTGTTSGSGVMMGLGVIGSGGGCRITPISTGRVHFEISGLISNSSAAVNTVLLSYGTGSAPANAGSPAGTGLGATPQAQTSTSVTGIPFYTGGIIIGLSLNTLYWFDLNAKATAGTNAPANIACSAFEF